MVGPHHYTLDVTWTGNRGSGTTGYRDYDRSVTIAAAEADGTGGTGPPDLLGSADPTFRGDRDRWNPEQLLVAALSQCHLLSYLHMAVRANVVVISYTDHATGEMVTEGLGGRFTGVTLHPHVVIDRTSDPEAARLIHADAAAACFIANSVNFPVTHEPIIEVGDGVVGPEES